MRAESPEVTLEGRREPHHPSVLGDDGCAQGCRMGLKGQHRSPPPSSHPQTQVGFVVGFSINTLLPSLGKY